MPSEDEERSALEHFRAVSGELRGVVIRGAPGQEPDFLINSDHGVIGVELTSFSKGLQSKGSSARENHALHEQLMERAERQFEATHGPTPLHVRPYFGGLTGLSRKNLDAAAAGVAAVVSRLGSTLVSGLGAEREADWDDLAAEGLEDKMARLVVSRPPGITRADWSPGSSGYASTDLNDLDQIIRAKEQKLAAYRQAFGEVWLLIHAPRVAGEDFDFEIAGPVRFQTTFDHVAYFSLFSDRYIYLDQASA